MLTITKSTPRTMESYAEARVLINASRARAHKPFDFDPNNDWRGAMKAEVSTDVADPSHDSGDDSSGFSEWGAVRPDGDVVEAFNDGQPTQQSHGNYVSWAWGAVARFH